VKIWSLLPSATEMLFALGLGDQVTGVTHECDFPAEAEKKPRVTISYIDSSVSSAEIDEQVTRHFAEGKQLYGIDEERLRADPPDVIVTQDLCPVCAVSPSDFAGHVTEAGCSPQIVTLNPNTLEDVLECVMTVGRATGREERATEYVASLRERLDAVRSATAGRLRRRTLCIEWLEPLMPGGHWVPEMVAIAGGEDVLGRAGEPSFRTTWADAFEREPEFVVLAPCGLDAEQAAHEARALEWPCRAVAVDALAYYSRPAPRIAGGIRPLAFLLHPERAPDPGLPWIDVA
jgi:iron complex transport system substrate-binding protein